MPRGNPDNLLKKDDLTPEQRRINASKAGKASGEARRRKKELREILDELLQQEVGRDSEGKPITGAMAMATKALKEAIGGDWKAWELVRDTAGQKPVKQIEATGTISPLAELMKSL